MKILEDSFTIIIPHPSKDVNRKHYIKATEVNGNDEKINFVMNTELLYGDADFY